MNNSESFFKRYWFIISMLVGIVAGCIVGAVWPGATALEPLGTVFINMMFCVVVPMVFCSIASAIANMGSAKRAGKVLGVTVAVEVIVLLMPARLVQPPDDPGAAAEDITVHLACREGGSGGTCERRDPSRAPHVTGRTAPTVASSEQQAMSIWNGSAPKRPSSAEEPVRLRERL